MHVAFLIPTLNRLGGAERQVMLLAKALAGRGLPVSVIALSGTGGQSAIDLRSNDVQFLSLHMRKGLADPRGWLRFRSWIEHNRPDVLHANLPHSVLMARWSRFGAPIRVLVETIHSPATGGLLRGFAYRTSVGQPDLVTAVSRPAADPWLIGGIANKNRLAILPNGIDLDFWRRDPEARPAIRQELGLGDEFVWIAVGRLEPVKDHATLLRAFAQLPDSTRLLIAGAGPLGRELAEMANRLRVESRVQFLGFQSDVRRWMHAADAFVLTSRWEGLPMAFLEAAACELPAVCTDIPAMREIVSCLPGSVLVPVGNTDALASAMNAMKDLPECERARIARTLRGSVAHRFGLDSIVDRWEETYRALLALKPHPTRCGLVAASLRGSTLQLQ